MMTDDIFWYWLCSLETVGCQTGHKLLDYFESPRDIFDAKPEILENLPFLNDRMKKELMMQKSPDVIQRAYEGLEDRGLRFISEVSEEYPEKLKHIHDYPMGLFLRGKLPDPDRPAIAIVGARYCSGHGRMQASHFGKVLSEAGVQIISGMALGIDGASHRGALSAGQDTYAVLGCGPDICYPRENRDLYMEIPEHGGLISEYPVGRQPVPWQFPQRNRLISGFADQVLIVEARKRSGSLITADYALEQGKDVMAVPGRSEDALSAGCLELIKNGARLVTGPEEILEDYLGMAVKLKKNNICLAKIEKLVYSSLCLQPKYVEDISKELKLNLRETIQILCKLEKMGLVRQVYQNQYALCL